MLHASFETSPLWVFGHGSAASSDLLPFGPRVSWVSSVSCLGDRSSTARSASQLTPSGVLGSNNFHLGFHCCLFMLLSQFLASATHSRSFRTLRRQGLHNSNENESIKLLSTANTLQSAIAMSNFEQRFSFYFSFFDGQPTAWSSEIEEAYDAIIHESYLQTDGEQLTKAQLRLIHANALEEGTTSQIIHVKVEPRQNDEESCADVKFRLKSSLFDLTVHWNVILKDEKMFRAKSTAEGVDELLATRKLMLNFYQVEKRLIKRAGLYDGNKSSTREIARIFDDTYHDDFVFCIGDRKIRKEEIVATAKLLMAKPTKATVQICQPTDNTHAEFKDRVQLGDDLSFQEHLIVTIEGGKLIYAEPYDTDARNELNRATLQINKYLGSAKMSEVFP